MSSVSYGSPHHHHAIAIDDDATDTPLLVRGGGGTQVAAEGSSVSGKTPFPIPALKVSESAPPAPPSVIPKSPVVLAGRQTTGRYAYATSSSTPTVTSNSSAGGLGRSSPGRGGSGQSAVSSKALREELKRSRQPEKDKEL